MKIKYNVDFKRILFCNVNNKGKIEQMRVGEVELFQQNIDGTLDIVAKIWPQTPPSLVKQIEMNPGMMGMNSEALPVKGHLVAPDTAQFEAVDTECEHEYVSTFKNEREANDFRTCIKCLKHL